MIRRLAGYPGLIFAIVFAWKVALFGITMQPVPVNDSYFYDGPVVNALNWGKYCNPSLALALKISGTEVYSAYPPLYQGVLWVWMRAFGTSEIAAMALHMVLFGLYLFVVYQTLKRLKVPPVWSNLAALFLFVITFQDRPDSLAQLLGMCAIYSWVRARENSEPWAWVTTLFVVLTLATSLQLGGVYFCFIWFATVLSLLLRRERFPILPLVGTVLLPVALILMVKFGYPRLWAGFQEHAAQTPAVAGLRIPGVDDWLKVLRTVPGVCGVVALALWVWHRERKDALKELLRIESLVALVALSAVVGICGAAMGYLSTNFAITASYLQPLVVGGLLTVLAGRATFEAHKMRWIAVFLALATLGAVRAIGMSTWGLVCAADVSYGQALQIVSGSLNETPSRSTVAVSAAYLYEASRHKNIRAIHSDWLAPGRHKEHLVDLIVREKPRKLLLTQFDYYRHFVGPVAQLRGMPKVVSVVVKDSAHTPPPDASNRWQRVVQHISWAPVIVELEWR